jgi:hypothetical protein
MKSLAALTVLMALSVAPVARGQLAGGMYSGATVAVGPWQPSPYGGYYYAAPGYGYYGGGYGGSYYRHETLHELRSIRRELEDANWRRSWRR